MIIISWIKVPPAESSSVSFLGEFSGELSLFADFSSSDDGGGEDDFPSLLADFFSTSGVADFSSSDEDDDFSVVLSLLSELLPEGVLAMSFGGLERRRSSPSVSSSPILYHISVTHFVRP